MTGMFDTQFDGRRALVTGAARGMGHHIAEAFGRGGASVLLLDRDAGVLESAQKLVDSGIDAAGAVADVTDELSVRKAVAEAESRGWSHLDVVVNNAGVISVSDTASLTTQEYERVLRVNTVGPFIVTREALPLLSRSASGCVLNAASGQARQGFIYTPHYAASKFGVVGMTQSLAKELAPANIRVNAYCPGIVRTEMWEYLDTAWGQRLGDYEPGELIDEWIDDIPLKRPAEMEDVSNLLLFLASDAGRYITGQTINIDGGMFMN